ncbi:MAG TPA: DUF1697 domain-containing protein [Steroidobacteraceae bacterium]|nr:DUF1697 domain-containing protein [Steroidobacteraceae bacterium]
MATWIALLRGVGGGIRPLPMRPLAEALEAGGLKSVRTYIQSGNLVFESAKSATRLTSEIEGVIEKKFGFHSKTFVLSLPELQRAAAGNPFTKADDEPQTLHLFFLAKPAKTAQLDAMNEIKTKSEQFVLKEKVFYFYAPDGFGTSKLAAKAERLLGVETTARNWRTVGKLLEMAKK